MLCNGRECHGTNSQQFCLCIIIQVHALSHLAIQQSLAAVFDLKLLGVALDVLNVFISTSSVEDHIHIFTSHLQHTDKLKI